MKRLTSPERVPENGFGLIEFLIALLVLSVGLFGIATLLSRTVSANAQSREMTAATALAQQAIEDLKRQAQQESGFAAIASSGPSPATTNPSFTVTKTITPDTPLPGLKKARVDVTWENGSHRVSLSTLLSRE